MIHPILFKGTVVGGGLCTLAVGAVGELPIPASWEKLGVIGILGMGIVAAIRVINMLHKQNLDQQARYEAECKQQQIRSDALLRETVDVMRETRDVLKDFGGRK